MQLPTLKQLRTFLAVAETGSVSVAARALGLTQPAASQQLRALERILAARLFERINGVSVPTAAGRALLAPARRAQAAAEDAVAATADSRLGETGRIRVGSGATGCIYLLPPILAALKQAMPGLTVTVAIGDTAEVLRRLEAGELDLGLMTLPAATAAPLASTRLFSEPLMALLPAATAISAKAVTAAQLAGMPLILYESGGYTRTITDAWFRRAGIAPQPVMELGSFEAIKVLVGAGLGAAIVPRTALPVAVPGTTMHALRPALSRSVGYVMRQEKILDRGLRLLIRELEGFSASSPARGGVS